jgi:hypothetical protein
VDQGRPLGHPCQTLRLTDQIVIQIERATHRGLPSASNIHQMMTDVMHADGGDTAGEARAGRGGQISAASR